MRPLDSLSTAKGRFVALRCHDELAYEGAMRVGDCPSCRATVEFRPGAGKVKVCDFCHTVVLRGEAGLEKLGRVAELLDTESPLKVGLSGRYQSTPFTVAGRIQKSNGTSTWDEWYLSFDDEREAWLAESEGEWKLLFPMVESALPDTSALKPLAAFELKGKRFIVEEVSSATTVSAEGQLPSFEAQHTFVDATGPLGVFASLETAGGATEAYVGTFLELAALGFDARELSPTPRKDALSAARCTQCNGPLELKAPDATKRVACPYCGALLSVEGGRLAFLQLLERPPVSPAIPLGATATLADPTEAPLAAGSTPPVWTCLAFLVRSCDVEGTRYPWSEYLVWNRQRGFRWLIESTGHWTWLRPIAAGEVALGPQSAVYQGRHFRQYQTVYVTTDHVMGECYWTVSVGELARAVELIAPPSSLNIDETPSEATVTLGVLIDPEVLTKAFKLDPPLPSPVGIVSASVNPFTARTKELWGWTGLWAAMLLVVIIALAAMGSSQRFVKADFSVPPGAAPGSPESQSFSEPFVVPRDVPLEVTVSAPTLENNWLGVSLDLVNQTTGEVVSVYAEPSAYSGVADGERWSEGGVTSSKETETVDKGEYVLRVTPTFEVGRATPFTVEVQADEGPDALFPVAFLLLMLVPPLFNWARSSAFETRRWNEAVFQPEPGVSTFPHSKVSSDDDDDDD